MKPIYKLLSIVLFSAVLFSGCKKYDEQNFEFSPAVSPYVALKTYASKTVTQGNSFTFIVLVRTAFQEPVTITYAISGGLNLTGTFILPRNTLEGTVTVAIPAGSVPMGSSSVSGTLNLKTASKPSGPISVGRISPDTEKFYVTVTQ